MKKIFGILVCILFVGASIVSGYQIHSNPQPVDRGWLYVGGTGEGNYTVIQEAIDDANSGDTVFVYNGTYYEVLVVNKTIDLIGEDRDTTFIDGGWGTYVVYVSSDGVTVSGFTILNGYISIDLYASSNNTIMDNTASNTSYGIYLAYSNNNTIMDNNANSNNYIGILLDGSNNNTVTGNNANSNNYIGINLYASNNNTVTGNTASNNDIGIWPYASSNNNLLYHNNLINNTQNANDTSSNTWDNGYPSGGNYWSDYNGTDSDDDGIGDTPYDIPGGDNQDRYPFMEPNGWVPQPNHPPDKPDQPTGETNGKINTPYTYTTSTDDSDDDQVYYNWSWGDGSYSGWLGPFDSGSTATADHTWTTKGSYSVKVKAKDTSDEESDWSDPLAVTMPCSYDCPIIQFLKILFERFPHAFPLLRQLMGY